MRPQDIERERTCFAILRDLAGREFVLVGGYAISAYGFRRFSVDVDLVVPAPAVDGIREALRRRGMVMNREGTGLLAGRFEQWRLGGGVLPVSVDLMIDGITDPVSGVRRSYGELVNRSTFRRVGGIDSESWADARVPDREVLLVLKTQTGRSVDLMDVAVLAQGPYDLEDVRRLLRSCPPEIVRDHLSRLRTALGTQAFRDSVKGVFMLDEATYRRIARDAELLIDRLLANLE